jgi:hypothetical protein
MKKGLITALMAINASAFAADLLISIEEMTASNNSPPLFTAKSVPAKDAPVIALIAPKLTSPVTSPTVIEVKFQPAASSTVKPESFRVLYGSFEIDITKRILSLTKVTETGVFVQEASLPKGKHKLLMVVEDSSGRKGNRTVEFEVQ